MEKNFLQTIKDRNLINHSLLPIIFNDLLDDDDYWWDPDYDLPRLAQSISLFYFGLLQCYCFAKAQHEAKKLNNLSLDENIINPIADIWNVNTTNAFASTSELFSYYISASKETIDQAVFTPKFKDNIIKVKNAYEKLNADSRIELNNLTQEDFLSFLDSLPLLKTTIFSEHEMKFEFLFNNTTFKIKSSPFISFLSFESSPLGEPVDKVTSNCFILASVSKGQKNNELFFDAIRLDPSDNEKDFVKICRQVSDNEALKLLCQTADIETQWYPIDECWCDLKFLNKMVDASENVLLKCCEINTRFQMEEDIKEKLLTILNDTELYDVLLQRDEITPLELNEILFELFLVEGLFKTVKCIVLNPDDSTEFNSDVIFDLYMTELSAACSLTAEAISEYTEKCNKKIKIALKKLSNIVPSQSKTYDVRKRQIEAEWKTYYILKAAGIKTDSLFADVETILSIDDYYDMLKTNNTSTEEELMKLLRMLCVFYEALLENGDLFNEKKFFEDAERIAPQYNLSNHTIETLFTCFENIAKESEKSEQMTKLLGRSGIGIDAAECISFCKDCILSAKAAPKSNYYTIKNSYEHNVFISYDHDDIKKVKPVVERWKKAGIDLFFDETDVHRGENWLERAEKCMDGENCRLFIIFCSKGSICKQGVVKELRHVDYLNKKTKRNIKIIPINLEEEPIKDYLPEICTGHPNPTARRYANEVSDKNYIEMETSFINFCSTTEAALDKEILSIYNECLEATRDGRIITAYTFDELDLAAAHFYAFLKYGTYASKKANQIDDYFNNKNKIQSKCIYPIVASIKEAHIKRDNIAIVGYELIRGKGRNTETSHILTSKVLDVDDYYCIPKYRNSDRPGHYMIEPLLIKCDKFLEILSRTRGNEDE